MLHNLCISGTSCLKSEEVLPRVKEERNILQATKQRKAKSLDHKLCGNCLLKCVTEGNIEGMGRRGRRHKQLLRRYWKLKAPLFGFHSYSGKFLISSVQNMLVNRRASQDINHVRLIKLPLSLSVVA